MSFGVDVGGRGREGGVVKVVDDSLQYSGRERWRRAEGVMRGGGRRVWGGDKCVAG